MTRVRVESFTISLDGYGAGARQDIDNPLGVGGGERLFDGVDVRAAGYQCVQLVSSDKAMHVVLERRPVRSTPRVE